MAKAWVSGVENPCVGGSIPPQATINGDVALQSRWVFICQIPKYSWSTIALLDMTLGEFGLDAFLPCMVLMFF
jgi:hypothetical protein